jgi:hypothetical protein
MYIYHRISFNSSRTPEFLKMLINEGISYRELELPGGGNSLIIFEITEEDPKWSSISNYINEYGASDVIETFYSNDDIRKAEWLRMWVWFEQGYPQPQSTWPLSQQSYQLECSNCIIHQQIDSMRLKKEPHLGKKSFMGTIWTQEVFATPEVFSGLEALGAKGYEVWNAVIHKTGQPVENVRQLYVPEVAAPGFLPEDDLVRKTCPQCGRVKYYPHVRGVMQIKKDALPFHSDFALSHEWFGSGYIAWRELLVTNRVAQFIVDRGWQGVRFKVVELV